MKVNGFAILSLFSLMSGSIARPRSSFRAYDDNDPIDQKSRVTAFINTEEGLKVECWDIADLVSRGQVTRPDGSKGTVHQKDKALSSPVMDNRFPAVQIHTFPSGSSLWDSVGVQGNVIDFSDKANLFTIKDGLIYVEVSVAMTGSGVAAREDDRSQYVFADINGDDWFYFEDNTPSSWSQDECVKPAAESHFNVRTISGSDTTLIHFQYESTPQHKVLHEGRCNFAGLKPVSSLRQSDPDSERFHFWS